MITPNDIATKDFKKVAVGYSPEEVDTFLDDLYEDYERLYAETKKEKVQVEEASSQTEQITNLQKTLERTLTLAEAAAEETKAAAKAESEAIIQNAKLQAEEILQSARTKTYELEQEMAALQNRYELMRTRVKLLLYAEIELLDKNEILAEKDEVRKASE
ncbi:MAG TPA: DivIVA domain-containing protein [Clostridium sp.]|uniref:Cell division initiation protein n=1 Tax=Anaerotignum propionicum DSM 1682 TaxID=991789 RepID=A0A0X8VDJ6_ANAPI|nr:DivIVA domain-containing protein [Anaerotignum propionicum]AMJ41785.1 septum site-determining protein DivIVA [Anaerotignum propionicum DSM 1682]MEA5057432.1 DivIVA domain-containing protein [Anaerotignum propionicum]SHE84549.1 cell division initiation protein [[Clostridium] propionicum DSM 1682] [Anaerotignum propionicum DSM 1682]HBF66149.1 DivIVA domain-containing protein [Clostridium sp.]